MVLADTRNCCGHHCATTRAAGTTADVRSDGWLDQHLQLDPFSASQATQNPGPATFDQQFYSATQFPADPIAIKSIPFFQTAIPPTPHCSLARTSSGSGLFISEFRRLAMSKSTHTYEPTSRFLDAESRSAISWPERARLKDRLANAMGGKRLALFMGISLAVILNAMVARAELWALDVSGVWDGPGNKRIQWNPATGLIGNMGNAGVSYSVGAAPANAQAGAAAAASNGFNQWNIFALIPTVRINYVAAPAGPGVKIPTSWGVVDGAPGEATGAAPGYNPDPIVLNQNVTLRTDGWNLDLPGAQPNLINEYDVFTTVVHEAGHTLGLGHPQSLTQVMTPQDASRQNAGGSWAAVAQVTPFAGQPNTIGGAAQPNNALDYRNPRSSFGLGDALGAVTLYSAPIAKVSSAVTPLGLGRADYTYTLDNLSAHGTIGSTEVRSGYDTREVIIPVASGVPVSNLVAPSGWSLTREPDSVVATFVGSSTGLLPGDSVSFSFESVAMNMLTEPDLHWAIEGLGSCATPTDDARGCADPAFNTSDFTVLTGQYDYMFNDSADAWQTVLLDSVLTPTVAEPASLTLLGGGLAFVALLRRRVARQQARVRG